MRSALIVTMTIAFVTAHSAFACDSAKCKAKATEHAAPAKTEKADKKVEASEADEPKAMFGGIEKKTKFGAVGAHGQSTMLRERTPSK